MAFTRSAACRHMEAAGLIRLEPHLGEEKLGFPAGDVRREKSSHSAADEHQRKKTHPFLMIHGCRRRHESALVGPRRLSEPAALTEQLCNI